MRKSTPCIASFTLAVGLCSCTYDYPDPQETTRAAESSAKQTTAPAGTASSPIAAPEPAPFTVDPGHVPGMWGDLAGDGGVRVLEERGLKYGVLEYLGPVSGYGNGRDVDLSAGLQGWDILYTIPGSGRSVDVKAGEPVQIFVMRLARPRPNCWYLEASVSATLCGVSSVPFCKTAT